MTPWVAHTAGILLITGGVIILALLLVALAHAATGLVVRIHTAWSDMTSQNVKGQQPDVREHLLQQRERIVSQGQGLPTRDPQWYKEIERIIETNRKERGNDA